MQEQKRNTKEHSLNIKLMCHTKKVWERQMKQGLRQKAMTFDSGEGRCLPRVGL